MRRLPIALVLLALAMQACFKNEDPNLEVEELLEQQNFAISEHLKENNIAAEEDANGVFRVPLTENPEGVKVEIGDVTEVQYRITRLDGTLIGENTDSTMRVGYLKQNAEQEVLYAPYALRHALQYMREGEKYRFYAPFTFGYNNYELENVVPYRSIIVLELEVKEVFKTTDELLAKDVEIIEELIAEKGQDADTLAGSGIRKVLITAGEGEQPDEDDVAGVYYTGRFLTGDVFDTNTKAGSSLFTFTIGQNSTIPGFEKAVLSMEKGEKAVFYLPSREAYDNFGWYLAPAAVRADLKASGQYDRFVNIPPHSPLIFEIELKEVTKK